MSHASATAAASCCFPYSISCFVDQSKKSRRDASGSAAMALGISKGHSPSGMDSDSEDSEDSSKSTRSITLSPNFSVKDLEGSTSAWVVLAVLHLRRFLDGLPPLCVGLLLGRWRTAW